MSPVFLQHTLTFKAALASQAAWVGSLPLWKLVLSGWVTATAMAGPQGPDDCVCLCLIILRTRVFSLISHFSHSSILSKRIQSLTML